jgi:3-phosphoshikimate 1-carboxyvinyltransferase
MAREMWLAQASAQVKTCLLLAGLAADGNVVIHEPAPSRDHTERMLQSMGAAIQTPDPLTIELTPPTAALKPLAMRLPGDFSAAAFLMVAAVIVPGSDIWLHGFGLNLGRVGLLATLLEMGADITVTNQNVQGGEPQGDIHVRASKLQGVEVRGERVVQMIDEFPIFAVAAALAEGKTIVSDAKELRYKESDRIAVLVKQLQLVGVNITEKADGFTITGGQAISGGEVESMGDHRLAMSLAVAGLVSQQPVLIRQAEMINESFPQFVQVINGLGGRMAWL